MRTINSTLLPSKGLFGDVDIEIEPVKYGIISAKNNLPTDSVLHRMIKDFNIYIKTIPNWEKLCSFDYAALVFLKKYYTISDGKNSSFTVTCSSCSKQTTVTADLIEVLEFPDINEQLLDIFKVNIANTELKKRIPDMKEFESILIKLNTFPDNLDEPEIMLRAFFGFLESPNAVSEAFYNAVGEDIVLVKYLSDMCSLRAKYGPPIVCKHCKEVISVARSDYFATDPFRDILFNFKIPKAKIILSSDLQSRHMQPNSY